MSNATTEDRRKRQLMLETLEVRMAAQSASMRGDPLVRRILMKPAPGQREHMAERGVPIPDEEPYPEPEAGGYRLLKLA